MKHIASFLLATFVAISSFAQQSWTPIGEGNFGDLSVRNTTQIDTKGEFTAEFRIDYTKMVKTGDGDVLERSFMKVKMNCFSRDSTLLGDQHAANGALLPKYKNFWVKSGDQWSVAKTAGTLVINKVCPKNKFI